MPFPDFRTLDAAWWPFLYIFLAGVLPTQVWRISGVLVGDRFPADGRLVRFMKATATGLVAAVIARYVFYPPGLLSEVHLLWRLASVGSGFVAYLLVRQNVLAGLLVSQAVLYAGAGFSGLVPSLLAAR